MTQQTALPVTHIGQPSPERLRAAAKLLLERVEATRGEELRREVEAAREKGKAA